MTREEAQRGGLYYPDEDEPKGEDLISRAEAIEALGEEPLVWCDEEYEIAERNQWRDDVEAIKSVPSADRPRGEWIVRFDGNEQFCFCSVCKEQWYEDDLYMGGNEFPNYCPNCGAKMDGERSEK